MPLLLPAPPPRPLIHRSWPALFFLLAATLLRSAPAADLNATPQIAPAPDWVLPATWTAPERLVTHPAGEDFLLLDHQEKIATGEDYQHTVSQVVSEHGREDASQVYFYFDPSYQTLTIHHLKLIRGAETFDRLDPAKIQVLQQERDLDRQLYNGTRSALVILDDVRVGDIIDLAYTLRGTNPVFGNHFIDTQAFGWSSPVRQQRFRLLAPGDRHLNTKVVGSPEIPPVLKSLGDEQEITWTRTNTPVLDMEDRIPSTEYAYPFVDISEFRSWQEVVDWALPLYVVDDAPSPLVDALVAKVRAGSNSSEQRVIDALSFVQQEIRYLGIEMGAGSHRPSAPEEVLRRRFGDCKDKARLLSTVLQRLGLHAVPALVNSFRREAVRTRLSTPYAFDHVIVALDLGQQRYLLDPTLSYQRGDGLALRHVGRYGPYLRIAAGGTAALEDAKLGLSDVHENDIKEEFTCTSFDQPSTLTVTTISSGRAAENLRAYFATQPIDQINRTYLDYYTRYYSNISRAQPMDYVDQPRTNSFKLVEHYRFDRLFTPGDDKAILRAEFQPPTLWDYVRTGNLGQRQHDYSLSHPVKVREQIIIHLPKDWAVTPEKETIQDPAFVVNYACLQPDPRTIILDYHWESRAYAVEHAALAQFATNLRQVRNKLGYELTWNNAPAKVVPAAAPKGASLNWPMAALAAALCAAGAYVAWRLLRLPAPQPAPPLLTEAPPAETSIANDIYSHAHRGKHEGIGGWLILVGFGIVVRPFTWIYTMVDSRSAFFDQQIWNVITDPASDRYNKNFALVAPLEMAFDLVLLLYSVLMFVLFFRKSRLFPRAIQIYLGLAVLFTVFGLWDNHMLGHKLAAENYMIVIQTAVVAAIWIPYFQVSRRVKATFTR